MMTIIALLLIAYGYSHIAYKDFWWRDNQLLFQYFGVSVERNASWERQETLWGITWLACGALVLSYALLLAVI